MTDETLGLDDDVQQDPTPARDVDGIPYCRIHHCRMEQRSGGSKGSRKAYHGCPVKGCNETGIRIKTTREGIVPTRPQACPRCSQKTPVYCARDARLSSGSAVVLRCPRCQWRGAPLATPQFAAWHLAQRTRQRVPENGVGDR